MKYTKVTAALVFGLVLAFGCVIGVSAQQDDTMNQTTATKTNKNAMKASKNARATSKNRRMIMKNRRMMAKNRRHHRHMKGSKAVMGS